MKQNKIIYAIYRLYKAFLVSYRYAKRVFRYAFISKETATFTYNLTPENELYLMDLTAQILKIDIKIVENYFNELRENQDLKATVISYISSSPYRLKKDKRCDYGIKLAFYAIIRFLKPEVVVENGVEAGFTSIVLCDALRKNSEEGFNGRFIGIDINRKAGYLIKADSRYKAFSEILCCDAIESLKLLDAKIDFYFSDGLRTYLYERDEFGCLEKKLNDGAIVITNKATFSKALHELSYKISKKFSFFKEQPLGHWYEGAGIGIMH